MTAIPSALEIPLGDVVKAWREYRGWSVTEFATRTGIPKAYISELEHRKIATPGKKRMAQLAAGLEIDYWSLVQRQLPSPDTQHGQSEQPSRRVGGFSFSSPIAVGPVTHEDASENEEQLLRQLVAQVDEVRRTLDTLLGYKTRGDAHGRKR